jgi:hypothetical protein
MTQTPSPRDRVRLRRSSVFTKRPQIQDLEDGELAVNFNNSEPGLFVCDLDNSGNKRIRKLGPIHFGAIAPNSTASSYGFPVELSNGEAWIDTSAGVSKYLLKVWDQVAGVWIEVGGVTAKTDDYLDQFKNGADGENRIHTDGIRLKINNKVAFAGFSTTNGNKLVINESNQFANGVEVGGDIVVLGEVNAESLKVNSVEVWHAGNKPSFGDLANVVDNSRVDNSVVVYDQVQAKYTVNDVNTVLTITDGGNF